MSCATQWIPMRIYSYDDVTFRITLALWGKSTVYHWIPGILTNEKCLWIVVIVNKKKEIEIASRTNANKWNNFGQPLIERIQQKYFILYISIREHPSAFVAEHWSTNYCHTVAAFINMD